MRSAFIVHHFFPATVLASSSSNERQAFLDKVLWPIIEAYAFRQARGMASASEGTGMDDVAIGLFLKMQCDVLMHAKHTSRLVVAKNGRLDFVFEHRNNDPDFERVESFVRPALRQSLQKNVQNVIALALMEAEINHSADVLLSDFSHGFMQSLASGADVQDAGVFIENEITSLH